MNAEDVPRDRLFQHNLAAARPTTIHFDLVSSWLASVPFLDVPVDAGLVTCDPEVTRGLIFLPAAFENTDFSTRFGYTINEFQLNPGVEQDEKEGLVRYVLLKSREQAHEVEME